MRVVRPFFTSVATFTCILASGQIAAADVTGTWTGHYLVATSDGETRSVPICLVLRQDGAALTGSAGPDEKRQRPFDRASVAGAELTLEQDHASGRTLVLRLTVDDDAMSGTMEHKSESRPPTNVKLERQHR